MNPALPQQWRRSWACHEANCVEVAVDAPGVLVRDSKDPDGPVLRFTSDEWTAFVAGVSAGQFDLEQKLRDLAGSEGVGLGGDDL
jgi:hypothetical protein